MIRDLSFSEGVMLAFDHKAYRFIIFAPAILPAAYLLANSFEPARFAVFLVLAAFAALVIALMLADLKLAAATLTAVVIAYLSASLYYPFPASPADLHERFAKYLNPSIRTSVFQDFSTPLQDVYTGKHLGRSVGLWGAKNGSVQANFTHSRGAGVDGQPGYVTLWPGREAYFEIMPATALRPYYMDVVNATFSIALRAQTPIIANGKPHLFVCGGNHGCYYHKEPLAVGGTWTVNTRKFDPALFVSERGKNGDSAINVLKRAGYIGVMWISSTNWRGDVNLKTHVDIDNFRIDEYESIRS